MKRTELESSLALVTILAWGGSARAQDAEKEPYHFFKTSIKLISDEIRNIQQGSKASRQCCG